MRDVSKVKVYMDERGFVHVDNAIIISKNFSGAERFDKDGQVVNSKGERNFRIALNDEAGQFLSNLGLNVRATPPKDGEGEPLIALQIKVSYKFNDSRRPIIKKYTKKKFEIMDENNVSEIDSTYIEDADLVFRPNPWTVRGNSGITAWLRKLNYKIAEDDFDAKWDSMLEDEPSDDFMEEV